MNYSFRFGIETKNHAVNDTKTFNWHSRKAILTNPSFGLSRKRHNFIVTSKLSRRWLQRIAPIPTRLRCYDETAPIKASSSVWSINWWVSFLKMASDCRDFIVTMTKREGKLGHLWTFLFRWNSCAPDTKCFHVRDDEFTLPFLTPGLRISERFWLLRFPKACLRFVSEMKQQQKTGWEHNKSKPSQTLHNHVSFERKWRVYRSCFGVC